MADIPLEKANNEKKELKITPENAAQVTAFYTVQVYKRLGYLIKILEKQEEQK